MTRRAFAAAAHPDDIEFMMAGTMVLLAGKGYELHYMTVANGSCGSMTTDAVETAVIRTEESRNAVASLGAVYHEPLVDDLDIYYTPELVAKLCAVVREVDPEILLIPSPQDYMEDHTNASRLMVTAAFCRQMLNFPTDPPMPIVTSPLALYHAMPHELQDQLRNPVRPHFCVDVSSVIGRKREALACHRSQKEWLDASQGMDSYLVAMEEMSARVGKRYGRCDYAEGWRRHSHMGFADERFDPLVDALKDQIHPV